MSAYYNEIDPYCAAWLRNLISEGLIAPGDVDERDIRDVRPDELRGYTQCHFFAGVGVWSYALRLADWPDDRPVWTGSCPCQPFSAAGRHGGASDERHLWPHWNHNIEVCRPPVVFGEQVASKDGLGWLDLVSADLEGAGYAVGASDLCAAGCGAPHIRQRLFFVAEGVEHAALDGREQRRAEPGERGAVARRGDGRLADRFEPGLERHRGHGDDGHQPGRLGADAARSASEGGRAGRLADADGGDASAEGLQRGGEHGVGPQDASARLGHSGGVGSGQPATGAGERPRPTDGFWRDADWLLCRDGRWRPVEPGTFPLVDGAPARLGRLRAYGNAIVAEVAAEFVRAYESARSVEN